MRWAAPHPEAWELPCRLFACLDGDAAQSILRTGTSHLHTLATPLPTPHGTWLELLLPSIPPAPVQALSTRIYRGQAPEGATDAGISFLAFGGTALVRRCSTYEMGSAWEHPAVAAAISPKVAAKTAPSPKQAAVLAAAAAAAAGSRGGSAAASPAAKASNAAVRLEPAGADEEPGPLRGASPAAANANAAAAAADALLEEMVMLSPQCSAPVVGAFA